MVQEQLRRRSHVYGVWARKSEHDSKHDDDPSQRDLAKPFERAAIRPYQYLLPLISRRVESRYSGKAKQSDALSGSEAPRQCEEVFLRGQTNYGYRRQRVRTVALRATFSRHCSRSQTDIERPG